MNRLILSPRGACMVAVFLAAVMTLSVLWGAVKEQPARPTVIHPCALVLTRSGHGCR